MPAPKRIKPVDEMLVILSEHMEQLRPGNAPTAAQIQAAKQASKVAEVYLGAIMTCLEYYKVLGVTPTFEFVNLAEKPKLVSESPGIPASTAPGPRRA